MKTLVLIHGMWCHAGIIGGLAERFAARGYRVVMPELPGHCGGAADHSPDHGLRSLREYAQHLSQFLDALEALEPPVLIGHSMGGLLAQMVAASRPTGPLVLLNPAQPRGINIIYPSSAWTTLDVLLTPAFWRKSHLPAYSRARYGLLNCLSEEDARRVHATLVPESGRAFFELVFWFLDRQRVTAIDPSQIQVPILAVTGAKDRIIPPAVVRRVAAFYPTASYRCYPEHGHWIFAEPGSEQVIDDIDQWLQAQG